MVYILSQERVDSISEQEVLGEKNYMCVRLSPPTPFSLIRYTGMRSVKGTVIEPLGLKKDIDYDP